MPITRRNAITGILAALAAPRLPAQQQLDFLRDLTEFGDIRQMLPAYLKRRAHTLLAERKRTADRISTQQQVDERKAYVRKAITDAVGGFPERTPLNARVTGVLERPDYKIEKVIFESRPNFFVTANLYVPKTGQPPYPSVLYPLGHERGGKSHATWQYMLGSLAKKGYVALAWDPLGQGERAQTYDEDFEQRKLIRSTTEHSVLGVQCLLAGDNVAQYTIWDGRRALDYLLSRPEVDASRIACTGNSGGGTHTAYISALEDRIHVAMPSCYLTSWGHLIETIGPQDAEQVLLPWIGAGLDHPDFIYAFAPRPYLMLSAVRDFFAIGGARQTFAEAERLYERLGVSEKISMSEVDQGHGYHQPNREAAYNWLGKWFKGEEDRAPEPEIEIAAFEELRCTETGQVATSLGGEDVFTLNRKRAAALDPGLPAITNASGVSAYRKELTNRVRRLSGIEYQRGIPEVRAYGDISRPGYRIEKLSYVSEPGIFVPSLLFVPEGASGPRPAILYVHGRGKSAEASPGGEIEWFTQQGNVVLAIDPRGLGETSRLDDRNGSDFPRYFGDYDSAMTAFLIGKSLVGMRAADILRAVDLLATRSEVDSSRVSAVGKGDGAVPLLYAAALDDRIRELAFEQMLVSYRAVVEQRIHRGVLESIIPGVLRHFDLPDLIAALIPRKVLLVNTINPLGNRLWPEQAEKAYASTKGAFERAGAADAFRIARRKEEDGPQSVYKQWASTAAGKTESRA
jgi:cephalosporin-C deacetylase-like acetyl esterase